MSETYEQLEKKYQVERNRTLRIKKIITNCVDEIQLLQPSQFVDKKVQELINESYKKICIEVNQ